MMVGEHRVAVREGAREPPIPMIEVARAGGAPKTPDYPAKSVLECPMVHMSYFRRSCSPPPLRPSVPPTVRARRTSAVPSSMFDFSRALSPAILAMTSARRHLITFAARAACDQPPSFDTGRRACRMPPRYPGGRHRREQMLGRTRATSRRSAAERRRDRRFHGHRADLKQSSRRCSSHGCSRQPPVIICFPAARSGLAPRDPLNRRRAARRRVLIDEPMAAAMVDCDFRATGRGVDTAAARRKSSYLVGGMVYSGSVRVGGDK